MGDREVDDIIEQWRASARAAGEPVRSERGSILRRAIDRIGILRAVLAVTVVCIFTAVALPLLRAQPEPAGLSAPEATTPSGDPVRADAHALDDPSLASAKGAATVESPDGGTPQLPAGRVDDWFAVITDVDRVRAAAYAAADPTPLSEAFAPEGAAGAREAELVAALAENGAVTEGWRTEVLAVSQVEQAQDRAILRVRDRREEYRLLDRAGAATTVPASAPATWLVTVRREGDDWLVVDAVPEATSPTGPP